MWLIDEYPNKGRKLVWVNPPKLLIIMERIIKKNIIMDKEGRDKMIKIGATFCQDDKMKQFVHDKDCIIDGNQKW